MRFWNALQSKKAPRTSTLKASDSPQTYIYIYECGSAKVVFSCLLASHTAAQSTQAFLLRCQVAQSTQGYTTTTAGRMQAEKHRSALPCRLRSSAPRCPQVPFRRRSALPCRLRSTAPRCPRVPFRRSPRTRHRGAPATTGRPLAPRTATHIREGFYPPLGGGSQG